MRCNPARQANQRLRPRPRPSRRRTAASNAANKWTRPHANAATPPEVSLDIYTWDYGGDRNVSRQGVADAVVVEADASSIQRDWPLKIWSATLLDLATEVEIKEENDEDDDD